MDFETEQKHYEAQTGSIVAATVATYCKAGMFLAFGAAALGLVFL